MCGLSRIASIHRGDSNEYTQYTLFNIKKKITLNYPKSAAMGFFKAISVRATEALLYFALEMFQVIMILLVFLVHILAQ